MSHTSAPNSESPDAGKIWLDEEGFHHVTIANFVGPEWTRTVEQIAAIRDQKPLGTTFYWLCDLRELEELHSGVLNSMRHLSQNSSGDMLHFNALWMNQGYTSRLLRIIIQSIRNLYPQFNHTEIFFEEEAALAWLRANRTAQLKD